MVAWFLLTMYLQMNDDSYSNNEVDTTPYPQNTPPTSHSDPVPPQNNVVGGTSLIKRAELEQRMRDNAPVKSDPVAEQPPKQSGNPIQWPRINKSNQTSNEPATSKVPTRNKRKSDTGDLRPVSKPRRENKWTGLGADWDE